MRIFWLARRKSNYGLFEVKYYYSNNNNKSMILFATVILS
jgi:hypothetical protein